VKKIGHRLLPASRFVERIGKKQALGRASAMYGYRLLKFFPLREYRMVSRLVLTPMER
jgi:hypothetical protein